jgi:hypothetical protein
MNNPDQIIMTLNEFLAKAEPSDLFQQVADEIKQEEKETVLLDSVARRDEEWSLLANQVVGGETSLPFDHKSV